MRRRKREQTQASFSFSSEGTVISPNAGKDRVRFGDFSWTLVLVSGCCAYTMFGCKIKAEGKIVLYKGKKKEWKVRIII